MENFLAIQLGPDGAVISALRDIDTRCARPLRSIQVAQAEGREPDPADVAALAALEEQAAALRARLGS